MVVMVVVVAVVVVVVRAWWWRERGGGECVVVVVVVRAHLLPPARPSAPPPPRTLTPPACRRAGPQRLHDVCERAPPSDAGERRVVDDGVGHSRGTSRHRGLEPWAGRPLVSSRALG